MTPERAHVMFKVTGRRSGAGLEPLDPTDLQPALLAPYRDLTSLRYDFPLVLGGKTTPGVVFSEDGKNDPRRRSFGVFALSGIVDGVLQQIAHGEDGERVSRHVLRLEREIRGLAARGTRGTLATLWDQAAAALRATGEATVTDSLDRARAALAIDGAVVDCDADLPGRIVHHVWSEAQAAKAEQLRARAGRLVRRLSDILQADFARSAAGRTAARLEASLGSAHGSLFDFDAMSRVLTSAVPASGLPEARRRRLEDVIATLDAPEIHPPAACVFDRCTAALEAYRTRYPHVVALARALAMAELEAAGAYRDALHDAVFDGYGTEGLAPDEQALFPGYLITMHAAALDPVELAALMEICSAGLPMKVLVQWDDLLDESTLGDGHLAFGQRSRQLTHMAMAQQDVFVMQAASAHLYQVRQQLGDAMVWRGPALVNVFSGATGHAGPLPPYLVAAAAMASRVFPAFTRAPSAGSDGASRVHLADNPQVDRDWPVQRFTWENAGHQRVSADLPFTTADFAACDGRAARHFAHVPATGGLAPSLDVPGALAAESADAVPAMFMVDRRMRLQRVIVGDRILRETRRCRDAWRTLRAMGTPSSPPEAVSARHAPGPDAAGARTASTTPVAAPAPVADAPAAEAGAPGEPYIETPRCSTCNECTRINPNMFAYNDNKQAYVRNPSAGTFAQLVEAAESCQLSIIHPGKPRDPNEPGLDDLIARAESFQ